MIFSIATESFAKENYFRENALKFEVIYDDSEEPQVMLFSQRLQPIEEYLAEQFANHTKKVYVSQYDITLSEIMIILSEHYEYMVVSGNFGFNEKTDSVDDSNPTIDYIVPKYIFSSPDEDEEGRKFIKDSVKEYADYAKELTDDPVEQLLLVHDKLLKTTVYDFKDNIVSYSSYGLFKNNISVCQGYAEAMYMIAKELGIEGGFCSYRHREDERIIKGHIWNYFKIDNQWYHLDATWNDPDSCKETAGLYDTSSHEYFLASDAIIEEGHYSKDIWTTSLDEQPRCNSTKYESNYLFNLGGYFTTQYINGEFIADTLFVIGKDLSLSAIFKSKTLYIDYGIINSQASDVDEGYFVVHYFFEDYEKFNVIVCEKDNEMLSLCKVYTKIPATGRYPKHSLSGTQILKSDFSQTGDLTMYIWNISTLEPLSQKVELN